jgi:hypothetical protein
MKRVLRLRPSTTGDAGDDSLQLIYNPQMDEYHETE